MWRCTCKKRKIDVKGCQSGVPCFCMRCCACKKHRIDVKGRQSRASCFLYALVHWPYVRSEVSPLHQSGTLIANWGQPHSSSYCTETLIALRGPRGCALKANRSLFNSIIELKADCPGIQIYLHVSLIWLAGQYRSYASSSVHPLDVDQESPDTWLRQSI
jgi:hypothetical protein